jgi:multidrug efflux system outer membrane protein
MNTTPRSLAFLGISLLLAGCAVGPDYKRPPVETPPSYKEAGPWKEAAPRDAIAKGDWWRIFGDDELDGLEKRAAASNQNLRAAAARVAEARGTARIAEADFFPNITLDPTAQEVHVTRNELKPPGTNFASYTGTSYQVPLDLSYEVDLWGRVRRSFEASTQEAQASVADYEGVLLALKSDVAQDYFSLRALDSERQLLLQTVDLRKKALDIEQRRSAGGASSDLDVAQAETELASVQAQAADIAARRAKIEHALAVLLGSPASSFSLPEKPLVLALPPVPAGLPSDLLERRPDVAAAERRMAAANARIGVATAAFFPVVRLTGEFGVQSSDIANLFTWGSRSWGIGPSVSIPIFEGGALSANLKTVRAAYEETAAQYREQVLVAFADVEDGLSGLRILADEGAAQDHAVAAAKRAADLSRVRYDSGLVNYLQIVDAERTLLDNQRLAVQLLGQRFVTTVLLVKALGGGWADATLLPAEPKS